MDYGDRNYYNCNNGRPGLRVAVRLQVKVSGRRLGLQSIDCAPALSVTQKSVAAAAVYISFICCCLCLTVLYCNWRILSASEMTCIVSGGALNSTHSLGVYCTTCLMVVNDCDYPERACSAVLGSIEAASWLAGGESRRDGYRTWSYR